MNLGRKSSMLTAVSLLALLLSATLRTPAQAGRTNPTPQTAASPRNPDTRPAYVPDPNRDEYKLVFAAGYEDRLLATAPLRGQAKEQEAGRQLKQYEASFVDELNRIGAQGYRLVSIALAPWLAIVRRDENQYQYAIFETVSHQRFADDEFERKYAPLAQKGFRVANYTYIHGSCTSNDSDHFEPKRRHTPTRLICKHDSLFVLERQKNAETPSSYQVLYQRPTFRSKELEAELLEQLNDARKSDLYPTHMLTKFEVLTQSATSRQDFARDEYELQVAAGDFKKRLNELAQQGYRLMLNPDEFEAAILYRKKGVTMPASYVWIREKKLEQELPGLQERGAIYRFNYGCHGAWVGPLKMIFEQPSVSDGKRREYKILMVELRRVENVASQRVEFQLTTASAETVAIFNRLVKQGYEVRDFFNCDVSDFEKNGLLRAKILLERVE